MVGGQDNQSHIFGDIAALSAALGFAVFTISVRKGRTSDMMPAVFQSGVLCLPVMVLICIFTETPLREGSRDALIALLLRIIQMALGLLCPSSYKLGHKVGLSYGGSGSSVGLFMQPAFDVASVDTRLSVS